MIIQFGIRIDLLHAEYCEMYIKTKQMTEIALTGYSKNKKPAFTDT
jgi:hypothetical protein